MECLFAAKTFEICWNETVLCSRVCRRAHLTLEIKCHGELEKNGGQRDLIFSQRISFFFFFFFLKRLDFHRVVSSCPLLHLYLVNISQFSPSSACLSPPLQHLPLIPLVCTQMIFFFHFNFSHFPLSLRRSVQFDLVMGTFRPARTAGGGFVFPLAQSCSL